MLTPRSSQRSSMSTVMTTRARPCGLLRPIRAWRSAVSLRVLSIPDPWRYDTVARLVPDRWPGERAAINGKYRQNMRSSSFVSSLMRLPHL